MSKKGFTLIELLVVVSIISILAALTLTIFGRVMKNARDAQRKSNLQQYKAALEAYAGDNSGWYPLSAQNGNSNSSTGIYGSAGPIIDEYLPAKINDPTDTASYKYVYTGSSDGSSYVLEALLEAGGVWELCSTNGKVGKAAAETAPDGNCDL